MEKGSTNVYQDLEQPDADNMFIKAQLAAKIGEIIHQQSMTQQRAAEIMGMHQPKLSKLLRGQFRGVSEAKMMACLNSLGNDVEIVVRKVRNEYAKGETLGSFA